MATPEKISLYNLADLKNTTDDAIPNYLNSLKFKQSHFLTDVRLGLGYGAFLLAAACFAWDYFLGWDATKHFTAAAVVVYGVLSYGLTYWVMYQEKGVVYQGIAPSGEKLSIATSTKKHDPTYYVVAHIEVPNKDPKVYSCTTGFNSWFDETGLIVARPLQEFLASSIPLIGQLDPKNSRSASEKMLDVNPELLDAVMAANAAETSGAEAVEKKGGKRRKA